MIKRLAALALLAGLAAAPAMAVTYDAFTSFNGVNGNGGFTYGSVDITSFPNFLPFSGASGCNGKISQVVCLGDLPGAFKTTSGAHISGTVSVPGDALILHPGNTDQTAVYAMFVAPTTGIYSLTSTFTIQDSNPSGVDIIEFSIINGFLNGGLISHLDSGNLSFAFPPTPWPIALSAGDSFGFIVGRAGDYSYDSTGFNFSLTTVPEPATWGLMIVGFAFVGVAMRRRSAGIPSRLQAAIAA